MRRVTRPPKRWNKPISCIMIFNKNSSNLNKPNQPFSLVLKQFREMLPCKEFIESIPFFLRQLCLSPRCHRWQDGNDGSGRVFVWLTIFWKNADCLRIVTDDKAVARVVTQFFFRQFCLSHSCHRWLNGSNGSNQVFLTQFFLGFSGLIVVLGDKTVVGVELFLTQYFSKECWLTQNCHRRQNGSEGSDLIFF